jgi:hypothetical protein
MVVKEQKKIFLNKFLRHLTDEEKSSCDDIALPQLTDLL